jgi:hypothetical protein
MSEYNNETPTDPMIDLVEQLQYGSDPKEVGEKLRNAISSELLRTAGDVAVNQERKRTQEVLANLRARNPEVANDTRMDRVLEMDILQQQVNDLAKVHNWEDVKKALGHTPTAAEVAEWHLHARATGAPGVRSAEEILNSAMDSFEKWSGKKIPSRQKNPSQTILDRKTDFNKSRGLPPPAAAPESYNREAAQGRTPMGETALWMGMADDGHDPQDSRSNYIESRRAASRQARGLPGLPGR